MDKPLRVFCSYAPQDRRLLMQLRTHLRQLERQGLAVKIPPREHFVAEDQRIVGGGIELDRKYPACLGQRIAHRAVHLWRAAQGVGVLHAAAGNVGRANLAPFEQARQMFRAGSLAGMRANRV